MLTKEQVRARYVACYIGCEVKYPNIDNGYTVAILTGVSRTDGIETTYKRKKKGCAGDYLSFKSNGRHNCDALHTQLLLRPLSAITDEDAIELAKMMGFEVVEDTEDTCNGFIVDRECPPYVRVCVWEKCVIPEDVTEWDVKHINVNTSNYSIVDIYGMNAWTPEIIDYLRARGYYTGKFMGFNPIQEGWVIINDKNNEKDTNKHNGITSQG